MTDHKVHAIALRIAKESLSNIDYSAVYEDDEAGDLTEEEMQHIHRLICSATAILSQKEIRVICPVHNIPDCSPLLNGCSIPNKIHKEINKALQG